MDFTLLPNRHLKGAFVEYGLSLPPLVFSFQFNPETLTRGRTATYTSAGADGTSGSGCREGSEAQQRSCLTQVSVSEETIGLTLQLDANDDLNEGNLLAQNFGIGPQLSALELMMYPKSEELHGFPIGNFFGGTDQFGAAQAKTIPILLFVWGRKRVMPVIMTSLQITEQEYFPDLNPKRAQAAVQLRVLEGDIPPYKYSHDWRIALAAMNLANIGDLNVL
jgi:hypothetical protein